MKNNNLRKKNLIMLGILLGLAILIFFISIVRMSATG